jgi:predicted ATP-grasp superfamily ATP-dependent carboligase
LSRTDNLFFGGRRLHRTPTNDRIEIGFMVKSESLLIVGASARAAAFSALRAGLQPWCVDLFADADLRARCLVQAIAAKDYPRGLIRFFRDARPGPWIYTGALENHPKLIEQLSHERLLWGNPAEVLRRVRSPIKVARVLKAAGLACPEVRIRTEALPRNKRWLVKPLAWAGGVGIELWQLDETAARQRVYFQEFMDGTAGSAVFHAASHFQLASDSFSSPSPPASGGEGWGEGGNGAAQYPQPPHHRPLSPEAGERGEKGLVRLLGVTEQLIGESWLNARSFQWCGNIGPIQVSALLRGRLQALGEALVREFGLRSLFGVDFILRDDQPWPVEINPRYTGAVEVLEYASGQAFLGEPNPVRGRRVHSPMVGKAILFAQRDFRFPDVGPWMEVLRSPPPVEELPAFADIPAAGTLIECGQPVLTMFTQGNSVEQCRDQLQAIARELQQHLTAASK